MLLGDRIFIMDGIKHLNDELQTLKNNVTELNIKCENISKELNDKMMILDNEITVTALLEDIESIKNNTGYLKLKNIGKISKDEEQKRQMKVMISIS